MLVVKNRMNTIKQLGKGDNKCSLKTLMTSHNFLKVATKRTILKAFSTSISIITQLGWRLRRFGCPKGWPHNLKGLKFQTNGGDNYSRTTLEAIGQWSDLEKHLVHNNRTKTTNVLCHCQQCVSL
jgi:hypothetical protein